MKTPTWCNNLKCLFHRNRGRLRWNKHLRLLHQVGVFIYWYMMHRTIKLKFT